MNSYLYPTLPGWFEQLLDDWKNSGKSALCFPFLWFRPTTLPKDSNTTFWLYLYYSESQTEQEELKRAVKYRVRVMRYSFSVIESSNIYTLRDSESEAKVWFECNLVEEIRDLHGSLLHESDFEHTEGLALLQSIRNSIAPVRRLTDMITVQTTGYALND